MKSLIGLSVVGMMLSWVDYLLSTFRIMMVARDRIELPTRGFSGRYFEFFRLPFNRLAGRLLPDLHDDAPLCTSDSRKTHAAAATDPRTPDQTYISG
jgi:hypothetical protein